MYGELVHFNIYTSFLYNIIIIYMTFVVFIAHAQCDYPRGAM